MTTFIERLQLAMDKANKTKTDLWQACDITSGAVSQWFSKPTTQLRGKNLLKVAKLLNVTPEWLETGEGEKGDQVEKNEDKQKKERDRLLSLFDKMNPDAKEGWLKIGAILVSITPTANAVETDQPKPIESPPGRSLGSDIPPDPQDTSAFSHDPVGEIEKPQEIKKK